MDRFCTQAKEMRRNFFQYLLDSGQEEHAADLKVDEQDYLTVCLFVWRERERERARDDDDDEKGGGLAGRRKLHTTVASMPFSRRKKVC